MWDFILYVSFHLYENMEEYGFIVGKIMLVGMVTTAFIPKPIIKMLSMMTMFMVILNMIVSGEGFPVAKGVSFFIERSVEGYNAPKDVIAYLHASLKVNEEGSEAREPDVKEVQDDGEERDVRLQTLGGSGVVEQAMSQRKQSAEALRRFGVNVFAAFGMSAGVVEKPKEWAVESSDQNVSVADESEKAVEVEGDEGLETDSEPAIDSSDKEVGEDVPTEGESGREVENLEATARQDVGIKLSAMDIDVAMHYKFADDGVNAFAAFSVSAGVAEKAEGRAAEPSSQNTGGADESEKVVEAEKTDELETDGELAIDSSDKEVGEDVPTEGESGRGVENLEATARQDVGTKLSAVDIDVDMHYKFADDGVNAFAAFSVNAGVIEKAEGRAAEFSSQNTGGADESEKAVEVEKNDELETDREPAIDSSDEEVGEDASVKGESDQEITNPEATARRGVGTTPSAMDIDVGVHCSLAHGDVNVHAAVSVSVGVVEKPKKSAAEPSSQNAGGADESEKAVEAEKNDELETDREPAIDPSDEEVGKDASAEGESDQEITNPEATARQDVGITPPAMDIDVGVHYSLADGDVNVYAAVNVSADVVEKPKKRAAGPSGRNVNVAYESEKAGEAEKGDELIRGGDLTPARGGSNVNPLMASIFVAVAVPKSASPAASSPCNGTASFRPSDEVAPQVEVRPNFEIFGLEDSLDADLGFHVFEQIEKPFDEEEEEPESKYNPYTVGAVIRSYVMSVTLIVVFRTAWPSGYIGRQKGSSNRKG